jgi:hypothetical protein
MSTEHQRYWTDNQSDEIQKYADQHGMGDRSLSLPTNEALSVL